MKKIIITFVFLLIAGGMSFGQTSDPLVSNCAINAGAGAKYLKDFRVELGKSSDQNNMRYKAKMSLWKNTKYRFSFCNADNSKGKLFFSIKDESKVIVPSTYDKKSGKTYPFIDFICKKSGVYQLNFDFTDGQPGSGVCIVSMVR